MSIQVNEENGGKVLAIHASGKLVKADTPMPPRRGNGLAKHSGFDCDRHE